MKLSSFALILGSVAALCCATSATTWAQTLYSAPPEGARTRWVSPENPTGEAGRGGLTNRGAKGNAFYIVAPGAEQALLDWEGAGVIQRMWLSGTIPRNEEQRRLVRFDIFWDHEHKPAVSAPIGDFFGAGLGISVPFENDLFANPEGRSFVFTIPMPFRKAARMVITNESSAYALIWFDINLVEMNRIPDDALYFHAYWSRNRETTLGQDFEILPSVSGVGRYLGANIGVIGGEAYRGTWFGEGEVKAYLDGDRVWPSLVQTGTEDYIGSGWGQGAFHGRYAGSLLSDAEHDLYAFYRYHVPDPVFFHSDCRVTIQQMGNAPTERIREMLDQGAELRPVWVLDMHGEPDVLHIRGTAPEHVRLLDLPDAPNPHAPDFPTGATNFYRRDDVSATAYFYLDRPASELPPLPGPELRLAGMRERVWDVVRQQ